MKNLRKRLLALLCAVALLVGVIPMSAAAAELPFTDVSKTAWYYDAVEYAYENGLFNGVSDTSFDPNGTMTRAMFVQVLANATDNFNKEDYPSSSFSDVSSDAWFSSSVAWANEMGIVNGVGGNKFAPNSPVTREQMARIMYTYAAKTHNDVEFSTATFDSFPDKEAVASWGKVAMQWATDKKIINGSKKGNGNYLLPKNTATRAEVAQVLKNAQSVLVNKTVDKDAVVPDKPVDPVDPDIADIPAEDQYLFKGMTTTETVIEKETSMYSGARVVLPPQAPQKTKTTYTTYDGRTGTKYAAPSSLPKMQEVYNLCDKIEVDKTIESGFVTQEEVDKYEIFDIARFIAAVDVRTSAQWGNITGVEFSPNVYSDVKEFERGLVTEDARSWIAITKQPSTIHWEESGAEGLAHSLEKAGAKYYQIRVFGEGANAKIGIYIKK